MPGVPNGDGSGGPQGSRGFGWAGQIYPYVKSTGVFTCPSDTFSGTSTGVEVSYVYNDDIPGANDSGTYWPLIGVYGTISKLSSPSRTVLLAEMQGLCTDTADGCISATAPNLVDPLEFGGTHVASEYPSGVTGNIQRRDQYAAEVQTTAETNAGTWRVAGGLMTGTPNGLTASTWTTYVPGDRAAAGIHTNGSNYLCADGHVKWLSATNVSFGYDAASQTGADGATDFAPYVSAEGTSTNTHALTFSSI